MDEIKFKVRIFEHQSVGLGPPAAHQNLHPRGHLGQGEGLCEIIIPAGPQSSHPLVNIIKGADHQDGRIHAAGFERRGNGQPVQIGQHAIKGDGVIGAVLSQSQAFLSPRGAIDGEAVRGQLPRDLTCGGLVILDGQNTGQGVRGAYGEEAGQVRPVIRAQSGRRANARARPVGDCGSPEAPPRGRHAIQRG